MGMRLQFRLDGRTAEKLQGWAGPQGELSLGARELLERHLALIERELQEVSLSEAEASLLVDALNGILIEPHTAALLWANVAEAIRLEGLDRKWGVDGDALVAKLRGMCPGKLFAIGHAVETFWRSCSGRELREGLRAAGLLRGREGHKCE